MKRKPMRKKTIEVHEKETELFKQYKELIKQGYSPESEECMDLRREILSLHVDFCLSKAHNKYKNLVKKTGDVWEVANLVYLGLVRAFPNYDPDKGVYFTSFAEYDIRHVVSDFYYSDANIKPYDAELIRKLKKAKEEMLRKYGTEDRPIPDYQEVSGMSATNILKADAISTRADRVFISDSEFYDICGASDYGNPEKDTFEALRNETLMNALKKLSPVEREVIGLYYGFLENEPQTYNAISKKLNITVGEVKRIINKALMAIREDKEVREYYSIGKENDDSYETAEDYDFKIEY